MKIAITGATGFLGLHLVRELLRQQLGAHAAAMTTARVPSCSGHPRARHSKGPTLLRRPAGQTSQEPRDRQDARANRDVVRSWNPATG